MNNESLTSGSVIDDFPEVAVFSMGFSLPSACIKGFTGLRCRCFLL